MRTTEEQNLQTSKTVHSPVTGWASATSAQGSPAHPEIGPDFSSSSLGPTLRRLIAAGPEPRATATVPTGCPLPMGDLVDYLAESPDRFACTECAYFRTVELAPGGSMPRYDQPRIRYGFCTAPERTPMALVSAEPVVARPGAHASRVESDSRVLAALENGVTSVSEIARVSGLSQRVIWSSARRLKAGGVVDPELVLAR